MFRTALAGILVGLFLVRRESLFQLLGRDRQQLVHRFREGVELGIGMRHTAISLAQDILPVGVRLKPTP